MASPDNAPRGSYIYRYIYRAIKAAVLNLGRKLAADLRSDGMPVGIYHPGCGQSEMGDAYAEISATQSVKWLVVRFATPGPEANGTFETRDGRTHPF